MKVIDLVVKEKTSKNGNVYTGLFAILENGNEFLVCFVNSKLLEK